MNQEFTYRTQIRVDWKANRTYVSLEISAKRVVPNLNQRLWTRYLQMYRQSLHDVAARESMEILVWSVDLDFESETITHHVALSEARWGLSPVRIARALRPPQGYWMLDFLAKGLENGCPLKRQMLRAVEDQRLQRYDHQGRRLPAPLPVHLLAQALMETGWRLLISPGDKPYAYVNTATRRIYRRYYQETNESESERYDRTRSKKIDQRIEPTGDDLALDDILEAFQVAGCTDDEIAFCQATAEGKTLRELPEHLTRQTDTLWDERRVEAARGRLRRRRHKLRAAALSRSRWTSPRNNGPVYRERVPDGAEWQGLWTYTFTYEGDDLEILNDMIRQQLMKLVSKN